MIASLLILFVNIVLRELFSYSFTWIEGSTIYLIIWIVFLGIGIVYWDDSHLSMDFIYEKFSTKTKKVFNLIINILIIITSFYLLIYGFELTKKLYELNQYSTYANIPMYVVTMSIPLGALISIFIVIYKTVKQKRGE